MSTRILLADDHTLFREGLRRILEEQPDFEVVAETGSGIEAVDLARQYQPDLALLDVTMRELNGIEALKQIVRHSQRTAVAILSMHSDERYITRAMRSGARGYILKDSVEDGLIRGIHAMCRGQVFLSPAVSAIIERTQVQAGPKGPAAEDRYELLTDRERQIYHLLAEGMANKDIANRLSLSLHTVETHRTRIMEKMDLHSIAELVLSAVRRGLVR